MSRSKRVKVLEKKEQPKQIHIPCTHEIFGIEETCNCEELREKFRKKGRPMTLAEYFTLSKGA